jgi:biopolymer transport protein ExbD
VILPKAEKIKELAPAVVVTVSNKEVLIDKNPVISFDAVKAQEDWMIQPLYTQLQKALEAAKAKQEVGLQNQLRKAVNSNRGKDDEDPNHWRKVTVQADKGMDFLTIKKVMYTVTEAGAFEINFAVMKQAEEVAQ